MPPFEGSVSPADGWDLVHYTQSLRASAHEAELAAVGLKEEDRAVARERIWASLSGSTRDQQATTAGDSQEAPAPDIARGN
jgi:hypothetical protein